MKGRRKASAMDRILAWQAQITAERRVPPVVVGSRKSNRALWTPMSFQANCRLSMYTRRAKGVDREQGDLTRRHADRV